MSETTAEPADAQVRDAGLQPDVFESPELVPAALDVLLLTIDQSHNLLEDARSAHAN